MNNNNTSSFFASFTTTKGIRIVFPDNGMGGLGKPELKEYDEQRQAWRFVSGLTAENRRLHIEWANRQLAKLHENITNALKGTGKKGKDDSPDIERHAVPVDAGTPTSDTI